MEKKRTIRWFCLLRVLSSVFFFLRRNLLVFYIRFELVLLPIALIVMLYGSQPEKISRLYYAILYTGGFSLPFLVELIKLEGWLIRTNNSPIINIVRVGLFLRKIPVFLLHVWLPKTHVEAPTSARILLAGVLLKVGIFGIIKIIVFFGTVNFIVMLLRLMGIIIMSLITCLSRETKIMTALRRVTHINFALYGINILSVIIINGASLLRIRHGFIASNLFSFVGMLYNLNGTRIMVRLIGMFNYAIYFGYSIVIIYFSNAGIPPLLSFWGEFLLFLGLINIRTLLMCALIIYFIYAFFYRVYIIIHFRKRGIIINIRTNLLIINIIIIIILLFLNL